MLLGEHSVRTGKTPQQQKHIHHRHTTCNRGSNPAPASSHPDSQPLFRCWSQTRLSGWRIQTDGGGGQERLTAVFFLRDEFPTATLSEAAAQGSHKR